MKFSKLRLYRKENLKTCTTFEEEKRTKYILGNVYFGIVVFSCLSSTKPCLRFLLICFDREIKGFYQSSLGNEFDFTDIMNVSPNILAKNQNFRKLRHGFVNKRTMSTMTSSGKSGNLHLDGILLSKAYKDLDEKVQKSYV